MVTVTKREAVQALIRGALRAQREGDEVCALTLAGAAEDAMPREAGSAFEVMRDFRAWLTKTSQKASADTLNAERNWLKHYSAIQEPMMQIDTAEAMIIRCVTRYVSTYGLDDLTEEYNRHIGWPVFSAGPL